MAASSSSGSSSSSTQGGDHESGVSGVGSPASSFVMSFHGTESPWAAPIPTAQQQEPPPPPPRSEDEHEEEDDEDERKLTPEETEAALAEAEALRASSPSVAAALAGAASVSSSTYSSAAVAVAGEGGQRRQPGGSVGDEYRSLAEQKARGEERLRALVASKEHARRAFPHIRRVSKDYYLKIMVAGESGHGKTSFINNLFLSYTDGQDVKPHDGSRTRVEAFLADPDGLCTRFSVENEATLEHMHYTIQDTPGFGDDMDISKSIDMVLDHVEACNERYLAMETDAARTEAMGAQEDPRIDVCLYFVAAHRLKHIDLKFMRAIAARVALIPVIAKADSMTAEETVDFRQEIMAECEKHRIPLFDFGAEAKAGVGIPPDLIVPPFAVVASNKFNEVRGAGSFWPVRDYHWGTCEAFSTQHSDCTYLKRLLLEEGFHDLRQATEQRYLEYRRDHFAQETAARRAADARRAHHARRWLLTGFAALMLVAGLATLLLTPPPTAHEVPETELAWSRGGPLAFVFGRGGGVGRGGQDGDQLQALSARLQGKEAELAAAQQTIDLLVSSVRSLEASMSRLVGDTDNWEQGLEGGAAAAPPSLFVRVEDDDDVSAKSLSEIDRLLHRLGFGGVLASELAEAEAKEGGQRASATSAVPPSQHDVEEEEEKAAAASVPGAQQQIRAHRNSSKRGEVPSPPPSTKPAAAGAGAAQGASFYPFYSTCPSLSNNDHSGRCRHRRQAHKRGCGLGAWLEGVARYHEEKFIEGWERALRWFL